MNSLIMQINIIPSDFWAQYSGYTYFIIHFKKKIETGREMFNYARKQENVPNIMRLWI